MYKQNEWNENEKFSPEKIAQDILDMNKKSNPFFDYGVIESSCTSNIKTSCCIDTTKITNPP